MQFGALVCVWKSEDVCIMKAKNETNIRDTGAPSSFQSFSAQRSSVKEMIVTSSPINIGFSVKPCNKISRSNPFGKEQALIG